MLGLGCALSLTAATGPPAASRAAAPPGSGQAAPVVVVQLQVGGCGAAATTSGVASLVAPGVAVTAAHVVARADEITVVPSTPIREGRSGAAVIALDDRRDLALVRLTDPSIGGPGVAASPEPAAPTGWLRAATPSVDDVVTVHRADGSVVGATVRRTAPLVISDIWGTGRHGRAGLELATAEPLGPGDSGAPVVAHDGRLVGLVFAVTADAPTTAWATAVSEVTAFAGDVPRGNYRCDPARSRLVGP